MPNSAVIGEIIAEMWRIFDFSKRRRRHLGFLKGRNFNGRMDQEDQSASPCQTLQLSVKPLLRYGDFLIFRLFQDDSCPPSCICDARV